MNIINKIPSFGSLCLNLNKQWGWKLGAGLARGSWQDRMAGSQQVGLEGGSIVAWTLGVSLIVRSGVRIQWWMGHELASLPSRTADGTQA